MFEDVEEHVNNVTKTLFIFLILKKAIIYFIS